MPRHSPIWPSPCLTPIPTSRNSDTAGGTENNFGTGGTSVPTRFWRHARPALRCAGPRERLWCRRAAGSRQGLAVHGEGTGDGPVLTARSITGHCRNSPSRKRTVTRAALSSSSACRNLLQRGLRCPAQPCRPLPCAVGGGAGWSLIRLSGGPVPALVWGRDVCLRARGSDRFYWLVYGRASRGARSGACC